MGNIVNYLKQIITSEKGKDVRQSMHDAIKQVYDDAATSGNANMEVTFARGTENTLNDRLTKMDQVAETTTAQLATLMKYKGTFINIKEAPFKAKGDGTTDDTQIIKDAVLAVNGGTIYFPKGSYLVSSTIDFTCSVVFEDALNTAIIPKTGVSITPVVKIDNQVFKSYINLSVVRSARDTVNHDGIQISGYSNRLHIENIRAHNLNGYGIKMDAIWDSHIEQIHVESCGSVEFSKESFWIGATTDTVNQNTFISIQTENCEYAGLWVTDQAYSNRFIGIHAEYNGVNTPTLRLGGYRNQYYGSGHLGSGYAKVFVGGEGNTYHGIVFDTSHVEGTNANSGTKHFISECLLPKYIQFGGSTVVFSNCSINELEINGNNVKMFGGDVTTLSHIYTGGTNKNEFHDVEIDTITQAGSGAANLELFNCKVLNNVSLVGTGLKVNGGEFIGVTNISYMGGVKELKGVTFSNLNISGNNVMYGCGIYHSIIKGNLIIDSSNHSEIHLSTISGYVNGDDTSKIIKSYVSGEVIGLTVIN